MRTHKPGVYAVCPEGFVGAAGHIHSDECDSPEDVRTEIEDIRARWDGLSSEERSEVAGPRLDLGGGQVTQ